MSANDYRCWEASDSMSGSVNTDSESGETQVCVRRYVVGRIPNFNTVVAWVTAHYTPRYVLDGAGVELQDLGSGIVQPRIPKYWVRKRLTVKGIGNLYWDVSAEYETLLTKEEASNNPDDPQPGSVAWDTGGHTEHKTQAITQRRFGANAPNFDKAINVSGQSVNGIDIPSPGMKYSETWIMPVSLAMSCDYIGAVYTRTATTNVLRFRCFDPGTCLFLGASAQWQGDQPYVRVTFNFEARPNKEVILSGTSPELAGVVFTKKGWEHIWFLYKTAEDAGSLVQRPVAAYVDQVFEEEDWSALRLTAQSVAGAPRV